MDSLCASRLFLRKKDAIPLCCSPFFAVRPPWFSSFLLQERLLLLLPEPVARGGACSAFGFFVTRSSWSLVFGNPLFYFFFFDLFHCETFLVGGGFHRLHLPVVIKILQKLCEHS